MRNVKLVIWFFIIFILQTVAANYLKVQGVRPDFVLGFAMCIVVMENSFNAAMFMGILCGVLTGALCGKNFPCSVLVYTYSFIILLKLRKKAVNLPDIWKVLGYTAIITLIGETVSYLILYYSITYFTEAFLEMIIPAAIYNVVVALIIYPIAKRSLFKTEAKKKLII